MNKLQEIMNQSYDFPVDFKKRCKKADFVFVQDKSVDPFSGGGVLDRATMIEVNDNYMTFGPNRIKLSPTAQAGLEAIAKHWKKETKGMYGFVNWITDV